ncbi:MAG: response regulator, partial [Bacteroidaceae bacterium]|nr:response regulator [Bacteroidaceae bacterium]
QSVAVVGDPQLIPALLGAGNVDAVLLDMNFAQDRLDGQDGLFWLDRIMHRSGLENPPAVVMITAFGDVSLAVQSLKNGAVDFIEKPWDNNDLIRKLNEAILDRHIRIRAANLTPARQQDGSDDKPQQTLDQLERQSIEDAIQASGRNFTEAAERLGISRQTLYNKMKRYGIS